MNDQKMFDDKLLENFINTFYGYGNYQAKYWFIGMEEAGGDFNEINKRLNVWQTRGQQEIEDVAEYHEDLGYGELFKTGAKLQPTWNKLIRAVLSSEGNKNIHREDVRLYQTQLLGRKDKHTCLLELLPLPSPSTKHWIYNQHSHLPYLLGDKEVYKNHCVDMRLNHIKSKIPEFQPKAVVFYGFEYREYWQKIAKVDFVETPQGFYLAQTENTVFAITKHPVARGVTSEYFHEIGRMITAKSAETG